MSAAQDQTRRATVIRLSAAALVVWIVVAAASSIGNGAADTHSRMGKLALPGFADTRSEVQEIRFTMADDAYTLARSATGWTLKEAGNYPVRSDRLSELATGLETLALDVKRTRDPYKLDKIGLGDPANGGNGVLVELFGPDGALNDALLVGRKGETIYVREPDDTQTYRAIGNLPPFYNRRAWLDLDIIDMDQAAISSVRLIDQVGQSLYLRRTPGTDARSFRPAPPNEGDRLISRLAASTTALAASRIVPLNAKPASELTTPVVARHITETFDGLEVDLRAFREPDGLFVTLRAVEAGEGARRAQAINEKAEGWAFELSEYDWQDFTPPLNTLVERAPGPALPGPD